jgi:two-component system OmpR family response regulator
LYSHFDIRIRQCISAYVVMLTGRTEEPDLLTAFHDGADDSITRLFRLLELRAPTAAMTRRPLQVTAASLPPGRTAALGGPLLY